MNVKSNQQGSALIISMFILVVLAMIVSVITFIVLNGLRSSTKYSFATRSSYAAESGVEQALYYTFAARQNRSISATNIIQDVALFDKTLANNASYDVSAGIVQEAIKTDIKEGESIQLDLFQESTTGEYALLPLHENKSITLQVKWDEACADNNSKIEVSFAGWSPPQWEDFSDPDDFQNRYVVQCPGSGDGYECFYNGIGLDPGWLYKARIKALQCDITNVTVEPILSSTGDSIPTVNYIDITSTGKIGRTTQTIQARTLWRAPLVDYFDYVIFSEQPLTKNNTGTSIEITP